MVMRKTTARGFKRRMSKKRFEKVSGILFNDAKLNRLFGGESKVPRHVSLGDVRRKLAGKRKRRRKK